MKKDRMKNGAKKIAGMLLTAGVLACGITGCKEADSGNTSGSEKQTTEAGEHTSKNGIATLDNGVMREDLTALEVTNLMGNGINLGNTMEAYGRASLGVEAEVSEYETFWGQPVTTQEMITSMKEAGFDSIRIPIAWTNAMDFESGDYTIGEDYLNRIEEIMNYAFNEEMYVIINDHWDGGWWGMFGSKSEDTREKAMDMYVTMWTQIAERYGEYSDYLIFESGNEELGYRLNDTDIAADSGSLDDDACYEVTNLINQTFVDTIRATGGNNSNRFLLIAGFGTDIDSTCDNRYVMPTDSAQNKLLVSVHYYTPSGYCINESLSSWGNAEQYEEMNQLLRKMTMFTAQGYGVIIGEYAVFPENETTLKEGALAYTENFLNNCDQYGYCPMLWDTNNLFKKDGTGFWDQDLAAIYTNRSFAAQSDMSEEEIIAAAKEAKETDLSNAGSAVGVSADEAKAWIMYNSSDWSVMYCSQDRYDPTQITEGIVATDAEITGEGTYTVALDFTQTAAGYVNGVVFSAVGIANGESLYPGYCIEIMEVKVNGNPYTLTGKPYTTSDDKLCTRVNLYNSWVTAIPEEARTADQNTENVTPCVLDADTLGNVETIEVTFSYVAP